MFHSALSLYSFFFFFVLRTIFAHGYRIYLFIYVWENPKRRNKGVGAYIYVEGFYIGDKRSLCPFIFFCEKRTEPLLGFETCVYELEPFSLSLPLFFFSSCNDCVARRLERVFFGSFSLSLSVCYAVDLMIKATCTIFLFFLFFFRSMCCKSFGGYTKEASRG